ncbi:exodeoxyribonuclease V subunit beta [Caviibacterium pharyngocola]|uniref:RecBCD enzyme subunit RecB n=1 Tax=Caviibacterium pharyngocola TaxID=28159 RepID=A0A2M8RUY9_9PAST|nr:exodeoxyribonuclease V subunit beta [Caviibacterium pharyngocola]PJG82697.1 exodeoxyribonuclease V subunit beta [Caviibacterium pharyngocola]
MNEPTSLNPVTVPLNAVSLIEASAGTGKTHTIASLYLRLLLQAGEHCFARPLTVEQILVVTFTEMATQELRERIRERIYSAKQQLIRYRYSGDRTMIEDAFLADLIDHIPDIEQAVHRLTLAEQNMDLAAIYTIHGFCYRILMQYAFNSGIHFNLALVKDESELFEQITNEFWRENFYSQPLHIAEFIKKCFDSPSALLGKIRAYVSAEELRVDIAPTNVLAMSLAQFLQDYLDSRLTLVQAFKKKWLKQENELKALFQENRAQISRYRDDHNDSRFNAVRQWAASEDCSTLPEQLAKYFTQSAVNENTKKSAVPFSHNLLAETENFIEQIGDPTLDEAMLLYHCIRDIRRRLIDYKAHHNQKGFDDLLRLVSEALGGEQGAELAQLIRCQYPFAMIDEFQDTDALQYRIFSSVYMVQTETPTGFMMIGDPKQSIYKFRGADIFTYLQASRRTNNSFTLEHNWRSGQALIDCVNALFHFDEPSPFLFDEIRFLPVKAGKTLSPFVLDGKIEPALRCYLSESGDKRELAQACAQSIYRWLKSAVKNQAVFGEKTLQAKDIAVLVKDWKEAELVKIELQKLGITAVYLSDKSNVYEGTIAQELLVILKACLDPFNEKLILNAIAGELFGLTAAEIYAIKQDGWEQIVDRFMHYRQIWQKQGVLVMLHNLLLDKQLNERLLQNPNGERMITDLLHLAELLQQAARLNEGEAALLRWFEKQVHGISQTEEIIRLESERELVKIVTIHKSKGLAYDLVWLPFIGLPSRESTKRERGYKINTYYSAQHKSVLWDLDHSHRSDTTKESLAEEMRLLYVALTRAKYQVVIGLPQTFKGKWNALLYALSQGEIREQLSFKTPIYKADALLDKLIEKVGADKIVRQTIELSKNLLPLDSKLPQEKLSAAEFSGRIQYDWTITGFTDMLNKHNYNQAEQRKAKAEQNVAESAVKNVVLFDEAKDYDLNLSAPLNAEKTSHQAQPLEDYPQGYSPFDFPHGTRVGTELHRYFEKTDFTRPTEEESVRKLCHHLELSEEWVAPLKQWLEAILRTPLTADGESFALNRIARRDMLKEMQFYLKLTAHFDVAAFNRLLKKYHHLPSEPLILNRFQGMVRGFIDLVFRHNGKYYLLDYKSNLLGDQMQDYAGENLRQAILNGHYDWQYLLYCVALHRYLCRQDKQYDYDRDFGGVIYTFLRGMNGRDSNGVYFDKPDRRLIEELEALF